MESIMVFGANFQSINNGTIFRNTVSHAAAAGSSSNTSGTSTQSQSNIRHRKDLTEDERRDCIDDLFQRASGLALAKNSIGELSEKYGVSRWTLQRLWRSIKHYIRTRDHIQVSKDYKGKVGRKAIQLVIEELMDVPLRKRTNIRSLAKAMNINKSTVGRFVKWGKIRRHSNAMKPGLTQTNQLNRLRWCIGQIHTPIQHTPRFKDMYNMLHVDEKWFFMSKNSETYYLSPSEIEPYRSARSKNYICKVMFITVVGRPRYDSDGVNTFDGKIGIYPLTESVPAQRSSVHRPRGTLETKSIKKIIREVIKDKFINEILSDIKSKWPLDANGEIWIQQDNATPHMAIDDPEFQAVANANDGFNINLLSQPPNSPDLNVLDLGFFRAIQSLQHQQAPNNIYELILAVKNAFQLFDVNLLNHVWLSYQYCMLEVLKVGGGNNYKVPHYGKQRMEREGMLPDSIEIPSNILQQAMTDMLTLYMDIASIEQHVEVQQTENAEGVDGDNAADNGNTEQAAVYMAEAEEAAMEVEDIQGMMNNLNIF